MPKNPRYLFLIINQAAGRYTLPQPLLDAHAELARLRSHVIPEPAKADPIGEAIAALRRAASTKQGALLTRVPGLTKAEDEIHAAHAARQALEAATTAATTDWEALVVEHLEDIVREDLGPVHAALVAEARRLAPLVAHISTPAEAVAADDATRAAYVRFDAITVQYGVVCETAARANEAGEVRVQHQGYAKHYAVVKNPAACWDDFTRLQHQVLANASGPWHGTYAQQLTWLAAHSEADAWLPTTTERNRLVAERHGAELEAHRRGLAGGRAVHTWGGRAA